MKLFGPMSAIVILLLGALAAGRARTAAEAADALRGLGTLLTVVAGIFSALWWHQSVSLSDQAGEEGLANSQQQKDANALNGAAATTTGLALIGSVFGNQSWTIIEGKLAGLAFLLLLAMSGSELWIAATLSFRQGFRPRSVLARLVLATAIVLFVLRYLIR
jgi:hypothetical protein